MIGVRTPETCWAVNKRLVINWRNSCFWLVVLFGFAEIVIIRPVICCSEWFRAGLLLLWALIQTAVLFHWSDATLYPSHCCQLRGYISVSLNFRRRKLVYAGCNSSLHTSPRIQSMPVTKTNSLVLYKEITALAAYCRNCMESLMGTILRF